MSDQQNARVLTVLAKHIGRINAIGTKDLVQEVARCHINEEDEPLSARHVRKNIEELRLQGNPICGHPNRGYWFAADEKDLEETSKFLTGRALKSLSQVAAMTKQSLATLLGQMQLPT